MPVFPLQGGSKGMWGTELRDFFSSWYNLTTGDVIQNKLPSHTMATLPAPDATNPGRLVRVTDGVGGVFMAGGTRWRPIAPYLDVTQPPFNADPTGAVDATSAFVAAHTALPSTGGTIFAPAGTYLFNQIVQANQFAITKSNVTVMGAGWATQLKKTVIGTITNNQAIIMIRPQASTISNIRIANLRITGPTPNTGEAIVVVPGVSMPFVQGILINDGTNAGGDITDVLIEGVLIENMESVAFGMTSNVLSAVRRVKFSRCWARAGRGNGFNPYGGGVYGLTIQDSFATDLDGFGMEMGNAGGMLLQGNTIQRTGQSGIGIEYNAVAGANYRTVIQNNYISDIATAAYLDASGISLGQSANPFNTTIEGNTIYRTGGDGIVIGLTPNQIDVHNNTIVDVGGNGVKRRGIMTGATGTNLRITGNRVMLVGAGYAMTYGITLSGLGSATNYIGGNMVAGATVVNIGANAPTVIGINHEGGIQTVQSQLTSVLATGTSPFVLASRTPVVNLRVEGVDIVATASLPAAAASQDGKVLIEDVGAGDRNLIIYGGGQRFRIDGGAAF